ncbi:unnamed protein product [Hyaloperonospora brassicae]|uniref:Major facilitator superfamily (MFS) profile domain-containing protein n=1 Tax=Hyaloperonospora brassicae TaxID=162125 RepID=A0AAV0TSX1_HYABA|nr:unnamed protein product [Hyaloperonospora brassicae]
MANNKYHLHRALLVAFAIVQCFLGSGVIFGWTSLVPMLEKERIYNELCGKASETAIVCNEQSDRLQYAFTMAVSSSMWSNLPLGLVLDKFGPRVTKAVSLVLLIAGALLVGNAHYRTDAAEPDLLLYGMMLVGFSGPGIQLSSIHVSNLFPETTAIVACFIVGGLQFSFFIFTLLDLAYMRLGLSMTAVFAIYAGVLFLALVGTLMTEPDTPFDAAASVEHEVLSPMRPPHAIKEDETARLLSTPELDTYCTRHHLPADELFSDGHLRHRSFRTQVLSKPFLLIVFFFSIQCLWCNVFLGSITALLRSKGLTDTTIDSLLSALAIVLPGSVVFIPLVGYLLEMCGYTYSSLICTAAALSFTAMLTSTSTEWIVAGFVTYAFFRTVLFSLLFAYVGHRFGFQHYGALSGTAFCIGGVVGLLQTPIAAIGDFQTIGYLQFGSLVLTLVTPYYERHFEQHVEQQQQYLQQLSSASYMNHERHETKGHEDRR